MHLKSVSIRSAEFPTTSAYPFSLPLLQHTSRVPLESAVTFFVGENGAGKTTLIEAIARRCGIHMWRRPDRARIEVNPHEQQFYRFVTPEWADGPVPGSFFGSDTFRHFTRSLDEWAAADPGMLEYFGGESLVTRSHGQSMMAYFTSRYRIRGLYLLDEPETALSPRNQLKLVRILHEMSSAGHAQFIVATHSPILLACPRAQILSFDGPSVSGIRYEQTEYYTLYKKFMDDPKGSVEGAVE